MIFYVKNEHMHLKIVELQAPMLLFNIIVADEI